MKCAKSLFVTAVGLAAFASAAAEPFFRTFFRNEENAAIRLKVKMPSKPLDGGFVDLLSLL